MIGKDSKFDEREWILDLYNKVNDLSISTLKEIGKVAIDIAEIKESMKPIREHVTIMNDELGQCFTRLDAIEKHGSEPYQEKFISLQSKFEDVCKKVEDLENEKLKSKVELKTLKYLLFGAVTGTAALLTIVYYVGFVLHWW
jgi:hypothetical protein